MLKKMFKILFFTFISLNFLNDFNQIKASATITPENITDDIALLKEIASKIVAQAHVLTPIQDKLSNFHSHDTKTAWSKITLKMIGDGKPYNYSGIKSTYGVLASIDKADLRAFFGKNISTFYTLTEISNIGQTITNAVQHGNFSKSTGGRAELRAYTFTLTYNTECGEICSRNKDATVEADINIQCQPATKIIIIFEAKQFFDYIIAHQDKQSWKHQNLTGSIMSIMSEK